MPIRRIYQCGECFHRIQVELPGEAWSAPPPSCPECDKREMAEQFQPVAIKGVKANNRDTANKMAEDIINNDYHVANFNRDPRQGATPKVQYKDQITPLATSTWGAGVNAQTLQAAVAAGRHTRLNFGSGLDVLQQNLKSGVQPDLIEISKRRSARIW